MAEPLKQMYHRGFFEGFAEKLKAVYPPFDTAAFLDRVFTGDWEALELKGRMRHSTMALSQTLPADYGDALEILLEASEGCSGFEYMIFPDFVEVFGLDDPDRSIPALERFTSVASAEFAVRPFIERYPERMLEQLKAWALSANHHVRRLASEGCRPRLPWAMALAAFKRDPSPMIPVLELLKEDPSEYVRKSVANHINDISKDHPELVKELAARWYGRHPHTDRIVKHACRTLLRRCDPEMLALFGYETPAFVHVSDFHVSPSAVPWKGTMEAAFIVHNESDRPRKLRIEYGIDYLKANGTHSRKLFKLSEREYAPGPTPLRFRQSFREMTTRKHYPGGHRAVLVVNGSTMAEADFTLLGNLIQ